MTDSNQNNMFERQKINTDSAEAIEQKEYEKGLDEKAKSLLNEFFELLSGIKFTGTDEIPGRLGYYSKIEVTLTDNKLKELRSNMKDIQSKMLDLDHSGYYMQVGQLDTAIVLLGSLTMTEEDIEFANNTN